MGSVCSSNSGELQDELRSHQAREATAPVILVKVDQTVADSSDNGLKSKSLKLPKDFSGDMSIPPPPPSTGPVLHKEKKTRRRTTNLMIDRKSFDVSGFSTRTSENDNIHNTNSTQIQALTARLAKHSRRQSADDDRRFAEMQAEIKRLKEGMERMEKRYKDTAKSEEQLKEEAKKLRDAASRSPASARNVELQLRRELKSIKEELETEKKEAKNREAKLLEQESELTEKMENESDTMQYEIDQLRETLEGTKFRLMVELDAKAGLEKEMESMAKELVGYASEISSLKNSHASAIQKIHEQDRYAMEQQRKFNSLLKAKDNEIQAMKNEEDGKISQKRPSALVAATAVGSGPAAGAAAGATITMKANSTLSTVEEKVAGELEVKIDVEEANRLVETNNLSPTHNITSSSNLLPPPTATSRMSREPPSPPPSDQEDSSQSDGFSFDAKDFPIGKTVGLVSRPHSRVQSYYPSESDDKVIKEEEEIDLREEELVVSAPPAPAAERGSESDSDIIPPPSTLTREEERQSRIRVASAFLENFRKRLEQVKKFEMETKNPKPTGRDLSVGPPPGEGSSASSMSEDLMAGMRKKDIEEIAAGLPRERRKSDDVRLSLIVVDEKRKENEQNGVEKRLYEANKSAAEEVQSVEEDFGMLRKRRISISRTGEGLDDIPNDAFMSKDTLRALDLSGNRIEHLSADVGALKNLRDLNLSSNNLSTLPSSLAKCGAMKALHLQGNRFNTVPAVVGQLRALERLRLDGNRLTELPAEIGFLFMLGELEVAGNRIVRLPEELGNLSRLRVLDAARNKLTYIPAEISDLTSLSILDLHGNSLRKFPEMLELESLRVLDLSNNVLAAFDSRVNFPALRRLGLANNSINRFNPAEGQYPMLEHVDLSNNLIADLEAFSNLSALKDLNLEGNQINSIPKGLSKKLGARLLWDGKI